MLIVPTSLAIPFTFF